MYENPYNILERVTTSIVPDAVMNESSDTNETPWCLSQYPNLSLHKPAWQSSIQYKGLAIQAVDGNREGDFWKGSCSLTAVDEVPWWVVDLQAEHIIIRVAITNRGGQDGNLKNYNLWQLLLNQQNVLPQV